MAKPVKSSPHLRLRGWFQALAQHWRFSEPDGHLGIRKPNPRKDRKVKAYYSKMVEIL